MEREILAPVEIADANGRLRPDAVGWSRHPIQGCALAPGLSRVARWSSWCITTRAHALTILVADVGYFGVALISFLDFAARSPVERVYLRPRGLPAAMPEDPRGDFVLDAWRLQLAMRTRGEQMRIEGSARTLLGRRIAIDLSVERPLAHETINVLVPWDETRFHFTSKQQALPARGVVRVDGREHDFESAFACLDFGRGRWPSSIAWNWAFASAPLGGRTLGFNLGGKWTDGTGVSENGFVLDGRVHKIADAVDFEIGSSWRIRTRTCERVNLQFDPIRERKVTLGIASLHQMFGRFSGTFVDDGGATVAIDDVIGLAESVRARLL